MSDYKMVPVVATEEMLEAGENSALRSVQQGCSEQLIADCAYTAMLAKAPPFVVTDEVAEKAAIALYHEEMGVTLQETWEQLHEETRRDFRRAARAALEVVLGGGV